MDPLNFNTITVSIIAFILIVLSILIMNVDKFSKKYKIGKRIIGPRSLPILDLLGTIQELQAKYRQTFRLWLGLELWVFLYSPNEVREALNDLSLSKPQAFEFLRIFLGNGLFLSQDKYWMQQRRLLSTAFHFNTLKFYTKKIAFHVDLLIEKLCTGEGNPVKIIDYLFPCILDVVIDALMGKNLQIQLSANDEYHRAFQTISRLLFERMINPLLHSDVIYKFTSKHQHLLDSINIVNKLMDTIIEEGSDNLLQFLKTDKHSSKGNPSNLLDVLLASKMQDEDLSKNVIRDELNTFVFAGVDTTVTAMSYVLYALVKYPDEQEKLIEEIQYIKANTEIHYLDDLNRYEYLEQFLKECLRYYTVIPITGRRTTSTTKIGQYIYPANVNLWINIFGLAHSSKFFAEPEDFRPSRFARENRSELNAFAYIPFGIGPHMCIGRKFAEQIMKIMTIKILERCELRLPKTYQEQLQFVTQMVLTCKKPIHLQFQKKIIKDNI